MLSLGLLLAAVLFCTHVGFAQETPAALASPIPEPPPAPFQEFFGGRIQRTMTLLATSTPQRRHPVRILVYGQSITQGAWTRQIEQYLRRTFPHAELEYVNRAIGGFTAPALVRTAVHDLYPFYPDLVIFHVYDGEYTGELERIISNIRRTTTAEIMLLTHHVVGVHQTETRAFAEQTQVEDESSDVIRHLAQKYDAELVEIREAWKQYLQTYGLDPRQLLGDHVHPNEAGNELFTKLVSRHFRLNTLWPNRWLDTVRTYEAKRALDESASDEIVFTGGGWERDGAAAVGRKADGVLRLEFDGNRVNAIAGACQDAALGTARVLIDGQPPSSFAGTYAITRPSEALDVWWPAIQRIGHAAPLLVEDWTLRITSINDEATDIAFEVSGSRTGPDGGGTNHERFVSNSGRVVIEPRDFGAMTFARTYRNKLCPLGFEVRWSVAPMFVDEYQPPRVEPDVRVHRTTLVQGLSNARHTLEIIPNGDGPVPIESIEVYRPPLR
ncbi:MAG: SGNH/GDSL hydrolase family protein [Phycisphaerae bacterium]|nr:SGNH/GDSL hydrolase family protein [Phycisphaerae bacterium]